MKSMLMKTILPVLFFLLCVQCVTAQITTQQLKAGFGVDGELRASFYSNIVQSANDDWFWMSAGSPTFVIDTTGASSIVSRYATDLDFRKLPFYRTMRVDPFTLMGSYRVIDAVFIRDYHGDDSTMFASGSNKNGMSPADWQCPVAQSIPDKNEILDMMVHVRRAGPNSTDSLWMFGGISIENTTGNRYFDFEMYQTDIYYDRVSRRFYGYGPDAGHTSWELNAAGDITKPGDIIFATEFGGSTIGVLQARIWVHQSALSITPADFNWTGTFDGLTNGSTYGYAGITPKTPGAFYTGIGSINGTWAGPFQLVKGDNSVVTTYTASQFMEFSVNLSKLGLDPVQLLGSDACGMPFRRILVKSRSSSSFDASLKDFVGPFDFFLAPRADVAADIPYYCGTMGVSQLQVTNPVSTSSYTWSTLDGNITGGTTGTTTTVNAPGTYVLTQRLQSGCSVYATDTVVITYDANCTVLEKYLINYDAQLKNNSAHVTWTTINSSDLKSYEVERSLDGINFESISKISAVASASSEINYSSLDNMNMISSPAVYYRLKIYFPNDVYRYSRIVQLKVPEKNMVSVIVSPNPVRESIRMNIYTPEGADVKVSVYNTEGKLFKVVPARLLRGSSFITIGDLQMWPEGTYNVQVLIGKEAYNRKIVLIK
jgi:hypothetical protein